MRKLIIVKDQADLEQKYLQLVHIIIKMRRAQKIYAASYLAVNLENRRYWEEKSDNFIDALNLKEDHREVKELYLQIQNKEAGG